MKTHLVVSGFFFSLLWCVVLFSDGGFDYVMLSGFLVACCIVSLFSPLFRKPKLSARSSDGTIWIYKYKQTSLEKIFVFLESKLKYLVRLRVFNERQILAQIPKTGKNYDAEKMATTMTRIAVTVFVPTTVIGIYLGITASEIFLVVCAVPAIIYMSPYIQLRLTIVERKSRIEEEMAYFLCYVNIMQTIGRGLYHSFKDIRGVRVFNAIAQDAGEIVKRVDMIGVTQNESLSVYAESHPSEVFRNFISGYLAKIASIGDVPSYTSEKAKQFFHLYRDSWDRYEKSAQEIFSAVLMVSIIMPLMIMASGMIGTSETTGTMLLLGTVMSPFIALLMVIILNTNQPITGNQIKITPISPIAGIMVAVIVYFAGVDLATTIVSGFLIGAVVNTMMVRNKLTEIRVIDSMLPEFMRDVTDMSKTGENIGQIIQRQAKNHSYKKQFNRIIDSIAAKIKKGETFDIAVSKMAFESIHVKFIMFLLAKTYRSGGGSTENFNTITEFVISVHETKERVSKGLRSMSMIVYASPFLMLGISHMMISMFAGGPDIPSDVNIPFLSSMGAIDERYIDGIEVMAALAVIPTGFVAAKIVSYTVKDTAPVIIVSVNTMIAMYAIPIVIKMFNLGGGGG